MSLMYEGHKFTALSTSLLHHFLSTPKIQIRQKTAGIRMERADKLWECSKTCRLKEGL